MPQRILGDLLMIIIIYFHNYCYHYLVSVCFQLKRQHIVKLTLIHCLLYPVYEWIQSSVVTILVFLCAPLPPADYSNSHPVQIRPSSYFTNKSSSTVSLTRIPYTSSAISSTKCQGWVVSDWWFFQANIIALDFENCVTKNIGCVVGLGKFSMS